MDVLYTDTRGKTVVKGSKSLSVGNPHMGPTENFNIDAKLAGAAPVQFRFTAPKNSGWLLGRLLRDPRYRG